MALTRTDLLVKIDTEKEKGLRDNDLVYVHGLIPDDESGLDTFGVRGIDTGESETDPAEPPARDIVCYVEFAAATVTVADLERALSTVPPAVNPPVLVYDEDTMQLIGVEHCSTARFDFSGEQYLALHVGAAAVPRLLAS